MTRGEDQKASAWLRCLGCGDLLWTGLPEPLWTGVLDCGCGGTPVIWGVIVPRSEEEAGPCLDAIRGGDARGARGRLTGKFEARLRQLERAGVPPRFRKFIRHGTLARLLESPLGAWVEEHLSGHKLIHRLSAAAQFHHYLRYRFSSPSFQATLPLVAMLKDQKEGLVLDAACGMGHLSFALSRVVGEERLVCADYDGAHVFAAKFFFVPGATALKADLGKRWPIEDGTFQAVFCSDALPYIPDKAMAIREMMRVVRDDGFVALPHLFNGAHPSRFASGALLPSDYVKLFEGYPIRLFPESHFAAAQADGAALDLTASFSEEQINQSQALTLVAGKNNDVFRVYPSVKSEVEEKSGHVELNELYERRETEEGIVLERRVPARYMNLNRGLEKLLPPRVVLRRDQVRPDGSFVVQQSLLEQGVMVEVPAKF